MQMDKKNLRAWRRSDPDRLETGAAVSKPSCRPSNFRPGARAAARGLWQQDLAGLADWLRGHIEPRRPKA